MVNKYVYLYMPEHPNAIGTKKLYFPEHRYVMEQSLGRLLTDQEVVHHINEITTDNRIENLMLMTPSEHNRLHAKERSRKNGVFHKE